MSLWLALGGTFFVIIAWCYGTSSDMFWPLMILANIWSVGSVLLQAIRDQNKKGAADRFESGDA